MAQLREQSVKKIVPLLGVFLLAPSFVLASPIPARQFATVYTSPGAVVQHIKQTEARSLRTFLSPWESELQRAHWLEGIENQKFRNILTSHYQPFDIIPGGTVGAVQYSLQTEQLLFGSDHIKKAWDLQRGVSKLIAKGKLNDAELERAKEFQTLLSRVLL